MLLIIFLQIIVWKNFLWKILLSYLIEKQKEKVSQKKKKAFNVIDSRFMLNGTFDTLYINIIRRGWNEANNPRDHDNLSRYRREKLNSRYRSISSTILVKLPRGCMDTKWTRNQVVLTEMEWKFDLSYFLQFPVWKYATKEATGKLLCLWYMYPCINWEMLLRISWEISR